MTLSHHRYLPPIILFLVGCQGLPTIEAAIDPAAPTTLDPLRAVIVHEEQSAQPEGWRSSGSYTYVWKLNGEIVADLTQNYVPAARTTRGDLWSVQITPVRGKTLGELATSPETEIVNSPPTSTPSITPEFPGASEDLVVDPYGIDADGDELTYAVAWLKDDAATSYTGLVLPAEATALGEAWTAVVTPSDPEGAGEPASVSATIGNGFPRVDSILLAPNPPREEDTITATVTASDPESDPIRLSYAWIVDGIVVKEGPDDTLDGSDFSRGQLVEVEVTPSDDDNDGYPVISDTLVVENTPANIDSTTISPAEIYEASVLSCVPAGWFDADGDAAAYRFEWFVDDALVASTDTLDGASFDKGNAVVCRAWPEDGFETGTSVDSAEANVLNTAPVLPSTAITPTIPSRADEVSVDMSAATDDDGDAITPQVTWYVNGSLSSTEAILTNGYYQRDDEVYAIVAPWDGTEAGATATAATVTVGNAPPSVTAIVLSPAAVYTTTTVTASVTLEDLDGDDVTESYSWLVDGGTAGSNQATLASSFFDKGDAVTVTVTPSDDTEAGTPVTSAAITVLNTPPTGLVVVIDPNRPIEAVEDLVCDVDTEAGDDDGDTLTYSASWTVDGVAFTGASTTTWSGDTIDAADTVAGETWMCTMVPDDGDDSGDPAQDSTEIAYPWDQVAGGKAHTCGVDTNGGITCWGDDTYGQATAPTSGTWSQVDAGGFHSCAIDSSTGLTCWGEDGDGQSTGAPYSTSWAEVHAGLKHTCGRYSTDAIYCWGRNLGGSTTNPSGTYAGFDVGDYHACAWTSTGAPKCWGRNTNGEATPPSSTTFSVIATGGNHSCGIDSTGALQCWGLDTSGEATPPSGTSYASVACGQKHCCALDTSGSASCWGDDSYGQATPPATAFESITAGWYHSCGTESDGVTTCWGDDRDGQSTLP